MNDPPDRRGAAPSRLARARKLALDFGPLRRSRDYRLLWSGELVSQTGTRVSLVAVYVQVFRLTHSSAAVGLVGLAQVLPLIVSTLAAGPVIDRADRRTLLVFAQVGLAMSSLILLLGAVAGHPPVLLVYGAVALTSVVTGIASPTRAALTPNLVTRDDLAGALVLNQVMWNTCMVVGPAVGGVMIARFGLTSAYAFDFATYGVAIAAALMLAPAPVRVAGAIRARARDALLEGFAYVRRQRVVQSIFVVDLIAMTFGMPRALFPQLARDQFHAGPQVVGALLAAIGFGGMAGALSAGWVGRVRRQGLAVLIAVAGWGVAIGAFGMAGDRLWLALLLLAMAGAADVVSAVFRGTILQTIVPDELRGRLSALNILVVMGGPGLGDLEAGTVAAVFSPTVSVVSGGVACVVGVALLARAVPDFARFELRRAPKDGTE